jgi:hypothetical protein
MFSRQQEFYGIASLDACDKSDIFSDVLKSFHAMLYFSPLWHQHCSISRVYMQLQAFLLDKKCQEALSKIFNIAKNIYCNKKP